MSSALTVELDCPEPRIQKDRLVVSADGTLWETRLNNGTYLDPATRTLMLAPLPTQPAWQTTFTGDYARYGAASYTFLTPGSWVEAPGPSGDSGDIYLLGLNTNERVTTASSFSANQAIYISQYIPGSETDYRPCLEFGWGTKGTVSGVWCRLYKDGTIDIFKGADVSNPVADYDLKGQAGFGLEKKAKRSESIAGRFHGLMVIPCRGRELLFLTNSGAGFSHAFEDLDPLLVDQTITPAGKFWWQALNGQPHIQFCPLKYTTYGTALGQVATLRYAPSGARTFDPIPAHVVPSTTSAIYSVVRPTGAPYIPDGVTKDLRAKVELVGTGSLTPFIYGVDMRMEQTRTTTANQPFDLTPYVTALSMSVPEQGPASCQITCRTPHRAEAAGLEKIQVTGDRPYRVAMNGIDLIRGRLSKPKVVLASTPEADVISWEGADRDRDLDDYYFADTLPYDGLQMVDVVADLSTTSGAQITDLLVSDDTFRLPFLPSVSEGNWTLMPKRGDSAGGWLRQIHDEFAATWISGWCPTLSGYKRAFRTPESFSLVPQMELFETTGDAAGHGIIPRLRSKRTIRGLRLLPESPEANQITVVGFDRATKRYVTSQFDDGASQAPETLPGLRPDNWRGFVSRYQFIAPQEISNKPSADRARDILAGRIASGRELIEIDCDLLIRETDSRPLWKGDTIRLYFARNYTGNTPGPFVARGDYQILAIPSIEWVSEQDPAIGGYVSIHNATYLLKKVGTGVDA